MAGFVLLQFNECSSTACGFVGSRFAKTMSACDRTSGMCSGIVWSAETESFAAMRYGTNGDDLVPCSQAEDVRDAFIALTIRDPEVASVAASFRAVSVLTRETIIPSLEAFIYSMGAIPPRRSVDTAMGRFVRILDLAFSSSNGSLKKLLLTPELTVKLHRLLTLITRQSLSSVQPIPSAMAHFIFDVSAWLGLSDALALEFVSATAAHSENAHRDRLESEFFSPPAFKDPTSVTSASLDISWLAQASHVGHLRSIASRSINSLVQLLAFTDWRGTNQLDAAEALLKYQIQTEICPQIHSVVYVVNAGVDGLWVRSVVALIQLCSEAGVPPPILLEVSLSLIWAWGPTSDNPLPFENVDQAVDVLINRFDSVQWYRRFDPKHVLDRKTFSSNLLRKYVEMAVPDGSSLVESLGSIDQYLTRATCLGTAIGLYLREGGFDSLQQVLGLEPGFVRSIFDTNIRLPNSVNERQQMVDSLLKPVHFIRTGIALALGPGGFLIYSNAVNL